MASFYLMQRFDMNEGFPDRSPKGLEPYISESYVLFCESGRMVPLENKGFGNVRGISENLAMSLKELQDLGHSIMGDVHPSFQTPIMIKEDIEVYYPFPSDSSDYSMLQNMGVNLIYS